MARDFPGRIGVVVEGALGLSVIPAGLTQPTVYVVLFDESAANLTSGCPVWYNGRWSAGSQANATSIEIIFRVFVSLVAILQRVLALDGNGAVRAPLQVQFPRDAPRRGIRRRCGQ